MMLFYQRFKKGSFVVFLLISLNTFAQKEANNWFFGRNAGIHFNDDGSVVALAGGHMQTNEGCSSISDTDGNLLFYTDGRTVWDRNHKIMPNGNYFAGTGLLGDPSSAQSAIIVPKKNDPNIYYVFTVDEPHHLNASVYPAAYTGTYPEGTPGNEQLQSIPMADDGLNNGLNYSVVDLSLTGSNGSMGDVTTRNVHLYTYDPTIIEEAKYKCSEKITAVKNDNGTGFWVLAHFTDKFYAFAVNASGVTTTPVITQIAPMVPTEGYRRNAIGCLKASPDGKYIAIGHQQRGTQTGEMATNGGAYLYDFNQATGVLSNLKIIAADIGPYGLEFSPQVKKLYVSMQDNTAGEARVYQYDLLSTNIASTEIQVAAGNTATTLQLGPNGKIYKAVNGGNSLDEISDPDADGTACGYTYNAVPLPAGSYGVFGLPPFITSLFSATIVVGQACLNQPTDLSLRVNGGYDAVSWNFGDGSPASAVDAPQHTYTLAGVYNVVATIQHDGISEDVIQEVTITPPPVANTPPTLVGCDADNDGVMNFVLTDNTTAILGSQPASGHTVYYYASQEDADANQNQVNAGAFTNTSNPQRIYTRVINNNNAGCYATSSFLIEAISGPDLLSTAFSVCDDVQDGNDANGEATFNLTDIATQMIQATGFSVTWYGSLANAQAQSNPLPQTYSSSSKVVFAHIQNSNFPACNAIEEITLTVNPLPADVQTALLVQCDPEVSPDGLTQFNIAEADSQFTAGATDLKVDYYASVADAQAQSNALVPFYTNITPFNDSIIARVENIGTGCYRLLPLALQVTANTMPDVTLELCDDSNEDGLTGFDLTTAGLEDATNTVAYYATEVDALLEQNALATQFTNTLAGGQAIFARIENNNSCLAIAKVNLFVRPLPGIVVNDTASVCLNTRAYIDLRAGINGPEYSFAWSTGEATQNIRVNEPGVYTVVVTDNSHATMCSKTRTITVMASNVAQITDVLVEDLSDNNTVTIVAVPVGNVQTQYQYSIDNPNGPWQDDPYFENVSQGLHTVYVNDMGGCGVVSSRIGVLAIPGYFTPNGDNHNDRWRIPGLSGANYSGSVVYIYDRYGHIVAFFDPQSAGWDGTYNGNPLPATDYWYVISINGSRTLKGHFSLLR